MAKTGGGGDGDGGLEVLQRLKSTDPPLFLTPSAELSLSSRAASQYIFSSLKPYAPKSPFDELLTGGFDAEQIWQQIDLQSQPLVSSLRREIKRFEREPSRIAKGFGAAKVADIELEDESESEGFEDDDDDVEDEEDEKDEKEEDSEEEEEEEMEVESEDYASGEEVEDKFLKIKELEKYLKEDEEREYGIKPKKASAKKKSKVKVDDEDEEIEEDEDEEDEDDDELGLFEEGDEDEELDNARYEDFYVSNKKPKKESKKIDRSDDWDEEDEQEDNKREKPSKESKQIDTSDDDLNEEEEHEDNKREKKLSRHEREQKQIQAKIKELEKSSMDPKTWTMQGEVTAAKRPLNSALEADLDFEHNVRPPPVITEEVTASIEDIIKKRIVEGRFDDVQRAAKLPSKAPKEFKELDESKNKKGLAEIYEEEYLEKTGAAPASLSFSDELKKEASLLFKRLTLKLNALSHFHFAPKPVVEDMTFETNLPALAMEEVAPVAVSDAAMLAPEEVFDGVGKLKEEAELTQDDRKRRRAKKKRKFKAEETKRMAKKPRETPVITQGEGKVAVVKV